MLDTSVLASALDAESAWNEWCSEAIVHALSRGPVFINPIVYAEVSVPFERIEDVDDALDPAIERQQIPWPAMFLAGKAFREYRRRGGVRRSPLPDFFIGAHAAVLGLDVVTRDPRRIRSYFPRVQVIHPGG